MNTLWLPVSHLRLWNWKFWEPYEGQTKLTAWLNLGEIARVGISFCLEAGQLRLYGSLSQIGDHPIDFKVHGVEPPMLQLNDAIHVGLGRMLDGGLRGLLTECLQNETLPPEWSGSPWKGKALWVPLGEVMATAKSASFGGYALAGHISFGRFLRYADVELASKLSPDAVTPTILNGVNDRLVISPQLTLWLAHAFEETGLSEFLRGLHESWQGEKAFIYQADDFQALLPIHLGFSPPAKVPSPA